MNDLAQDIPDSGSEGGGSTPPERKSEDRDERQEKHRSYETQSLVSGKSSKRKSEVRSTHSIHDRLQMESNFTFDLRPRSEEESSREFLVDLYLYLPNALGVNRSSYDSSAFFKHRTTYYRVRAPLYHALRTIDPQDFRLDSVDKYFAGHLSTIERDRLGRKVVQDVRLFGNFLHTEFKKLLKILSPKRKALKDKRKAELRGVLSQRTQLLWAFRERYVDSIHGDRYVLDEDVIRACKLTDEYLSYRLELLLLRAQEVLPDGSDVYKTFLREELDYREKRGMLILEENEDNPVPFEAYTYRLGLLKKYMGEALFLTLKSIKKDKLYKNYAAAVGAGLAATVAGLAEHQRAQYYTGEDSSLRIALLIGVAVMAYMFKDRVKDLSKEYFNTRLKKKLPDSYVALSHTSYTSKGKTKVRDLGTVSEYLRFLKEVPADVAYLRTLNQSGTSDPERRESVLHIGRRFTFELRSKKHRKLFPLLKNVHRIDISPFLSKLDNPSMPISFVSKKGEAHTVQAPKVYHINAVIRYEARFGTASGTRFVDYERVRLVINKNGIVRLEKVLERGRLAYEEELE